MKLWAPFNGDINLVKEYKGTDIVGWFGSCPEISPSARETEVLKTKRRQDFFEAVHEIHRAGMKFAYTYNSIVDNDTTETMAILEDISALRPDRIIFASPFPLILARDMKPKPVFEISTIAEIINPQQCVEWKKLGATKFTLSTRLSRFPEMIKQGFKEHDVKVMLNEVCNLNCIFRKTHYILQSMNVVFDKYPRNYCQKLTMQNWPEQILKNNWVLPSQLKLYSSNVEFKVVGRTQPSWRIKQWLNYYLTEKDPVDIMDILPWGKGVADTSPDAGFAPIEGSQPKLLKSKIDPRFFEFFKTQDVPCYAKNCEECGFCKKIAKEYNKG